MDQKTYCTSDFLTEKWYEDDHIAARWSLCPGPERGLPGGRGGGQPQSRGRAGRHSSN